MKRIILTLMVVFISVIATAHPSSEPKTIRISKHYKNIEYRLSVDVPDSKDIDNIKLLNFIFNTTIEMLNTYGEEVYPDTKPAIKTVAALRKNLSSLTDQHLKVNQDLGDLSVEWTLRLVSEGDKYLCYKNEYNQNQGSMYPLISTFIIRKSDFKRITEFVKEDKIAELNTKIGKNLDEYLCNDLANRSELIDYLHEYNEYELTEDCWIDSQYFYIQQQKPIGATPYGPCYIRISLSEMTPYLTEELKALIR